MSRVHSSKATFQNAAQSNAKADSTVISIRMSAADKAALETEANGERLSVYARDKLLSGGARSRRGPTIEDRVALAQVLRALAASNLALNLKMLLDAGNDGSMAFSEQLHLCLFQASADVAAMRKDLIKALGLRPK